MVDGWLKISKRLDMWRHTFATRLFEEGADPKTISELLGHTNVAFTLNTYAHVMQNKKQETIDLLNSISI